MKDFFDTMKLRLILNVVLFVLLWTLADFLINKFVFHEAFLYNVRDHILEPAGIAVLVTVGEYSFRKRKSR